jgi:hypothetical protein
MCTFSAASLELPYGESGTGNDAARKYDPLTTGRGRPGAHILRTVEIRFEIFVRLVARFPVNGGQVEDEIGIGEKAVRDWLANVPANPGRSSRLEFAMEWRRPGFVARRIQVDENDLLRQILSEPVHGHMGADKSCTPEQDYCAIAVHGAQAGCFHV